MSAQEAADRRMAMILERLYRDRIKAAMTAPGANLLPPFAPVVAQLMRCYRPVVPPRNTPDNMDSRAICEELEDMAHLEVNEVAQIMLFLGYEMNYESMDWAMEYVGQEAPVDISELEEEEREASGDTPTIRDVMEDARKKLH